MTRLSFGAAPDDDDVLVIQGVEYRRQPMGMGAFRRALALYRVNGEPTATDGVVSDASLDAAIAIVSANVVPEQRDQLLAQIDERVPPGLLVEISQALIGSMADVDPTQPRSSSAGSTATGSPSTDGAPLTASTRSP